MKKFLMMLMILFSFNVFAEVKKQEVLTGNQVLTMLNAAFNEAKENKFNVTITVVDKSGRVLGVIKSEDAPVHTIEASFKKAYTSASLRRETAAVYKGIKEGKIPEELKTLDSNFTVLEGGLPIVINGVVVGGIGVGGAQSYQDAQVARKALETLGKMMK